MSLKIEFDREELRPLVHLAVAEALESLSRGIDPAPIDPRQSYSHPSPLCT